MAAVNTCLLKALKTSKLLKYGIYIKCLSKRTRWRLGPGTLKCMGIQLSSTRESYINSISHKGGQYWSMTSAYPRLKRILVIFYKICIPGCNSSCLIFTKRELTTKRRIFR